MALMRCRRLKRSTHWSCRCDANLIPSKADHLDNAATALQGDAQHGHALIVEKAAQNDGGRALRAAKATGELFDLVEPKDSRPTDPQRQAGTDADAQTDSTQRLVGAMATMKTLRDHRQRWRKV